MSRSSRNGPGSDIHLAWPPNSSIISPDPPSSDPAVGAVLYGTDDAREGVAAFVEKRKPRFSGH